MGKALGNTYNSTAAHIKMSDDNKKKGRR